MHNTKSQIKFKTSKLTSSLCHYSDAYIPVSGTITVPNRGTAANPNNIIIKSLAPFTEFVSRIKNTQIDNAKDIDIVMPLHSLTEYCGNYSKTSGSLWQF